MPYSVVIPKRVQKEINKIDDRYRGRIFVAMASLANDPYLGKKLDGEHADKRSYAIWPYRIIYTFKKGELIVLIIRVGHRQGVFE